MGGAKVVRGWDVADDRDLGDPIPSSRSWMEGRRGMSAAGVPAGQEERSFGSHPGKKIGHRRSFKEFLVHLLASQDSEAAQHHHCAWWGSGLADLSGEGSPTISIMAAISSCTILLSTDAYNGREKG